MSRCADRRVSLLLCLGLLLLAPRAGQAAAALRVVTTCTDLAALAAAVGGEQVHARSLGGPGDDLHFLDARPSLLVPLHRADALVVIGLEMEVGWLPPLLTSARNARIQPGAPGHIDASTMARLLEVEGGRVDRARGDVHAGGNPHYLHDPRNAARVARGLAEHLGRLAPGHAAAFLARAEAFAARLEAAATDQAARFSALPAARRKAVSYHKSLTYLFDWLQLNDVIQFEPLPGIPPTPGHLKRVVDTMREQGAALIVQERYYPQRSARTVASLVGARLVAIDAWAPNTDPDAYLAFVAARASSLYEALSP